MKRKAKEPAKAVTNGKYEGTIIAASGQRGSVTLSSGYFVMTADGRRIYF